jgi:hypothetical protein
LLIIPRFDFATVETRLLILNADPVFQDRAIAIFDEMDGIETRIVRTMSEAIGVLLAENFDGFIVEGETPVALEQATNARQHFPSLRIVCLTPRRRAANRSRLRTNRRSSASSRPERSPATLRAAGVCGLA